MSDGEVRLDAASEWRDGKLWGGAAYRGRWYWFGRPMEEDRDRLPCPVCGSAKLETYANVIGCNECGHYGPAQEGPEILCDWREAIIDWNNDPLRNLSEPWNLAVLEPLPLPPQENE
jgi:hypothetical protein